MPPDPRVHVGVAAWIVQDGRLLMIHRSGVGEYASDGHDTWSVPGGWLDYPEDPRLAVVRESLEETGADIIDDGLPIEATWGLSDDGRRSITTLWLRCHWGGRIEPHVTEPDKCSEVEWVPPERVGERRLFSSFQRYTDTYRPDLAEAWAAA